MDASVGLTQFGGACVVVYITQKLKSLDSLPRVQKIATEWARVASIVSAFLIHAGISYTWEPQIGSDGLRHLILGIPTWYDIIVYLWHWACQYMGQEVLYQATVNKVAVTTDSAGSIPARTAPGGALVVPSEAKV